MSFYIKILYYNLLEYPNYKILYWFLKELRILKNFPHIITRLEDV
jgi:hypothetical protein